VNFLKVGSRNPKFVLIANIFINIAVGAAKWTGGLLGNSQALLADALETTADIVSSIVILFGYQKATQAPDHNHPYGHGKIEAITSLVIGLVLVLSAMLIIYASVQSLLLPDKIPPKFFTLFIAVAVIVVKEVLYRVFKKLSFKFHSSLLKNEAVHHRIDAFTTIITLVGLGLSLLSSDKFWYGDQLAAIIASAIIFYNAYRITRNALSELMDEQSYPEISQLVESIASIIEDIDSFEKCYVRKSGNRYYCDIHIRVNANFSVKKGHDIAHLLKDNAQAANRLIEDVHIHVEPSFDLGSEE
jgi:cation diffusion facilitator family transporter